MIGADDGTEAERPKHTVELSTFYMDRTEVPNADYAECEKAKVCPRRGPASGKAKELAGKKVAVLASAYGTPAAVIRAKFESEFGSDIGRLAACAVVQRKDDEALRGATVEAFLAELAQA